MTTKKITLITRLRTENAGNEALSETFIRFLDHSLPSAEIRVLDRIPQAMSHLNCQPLRQSSDPIAMFDAIAEDLAERARNTKSATLAPTTKEARAFIVEKPRLRSPIMSWLKKQIGRAHV